MLRVSLISSVFAILLGGAAVADCSGDVCDDVMVTWLQIHADGNAYFGTDEDETDLASCDPVGDYLIYLSAASAGREQTVSTLMTAHATGQRIDFRVLSGSGTCTVRWVALYPQTQSASAMSSFAQADMTATRSAALAIGGTERYSSEIPGSALGGGE